IFVFTSSDDIGSYIHPDSRRRKCISANFKKKPLRDRATSIPSWHDGPSYNSICRSRQQISVLTSSDDIGSYIHPGSRRRKCISANFKKKPLRDRATSIPSWHDGPSYNSICRSRQQISVFTSSDDIGSYIHPGSRRRKCISANFKKKPLRDRATSIPSWHDGPSHNSLCRSRQQISVFTSSDDIGSYIHPGSRRRKCISANFKKKPLRDRATSIPSWHDGPSHNSLCRSRQQISVFTSSDDIGSYIHPGSRRRKCISANFKKKPLRDRATSIPSWHDGPSHNSLSRYRRQIFVFTSSDDIGSYIHPDSRRRKCISANFK